MIKLELIKENREAMTKQLVELAVKQGEELSNHLVGDLYAVDRKIKTIEEIPEDLREAFIEFADDYTSILYSSFTFDW